MSSAKPPPAFRDGSQPVPTLKRESLAQAPKEPATPQEQWVQLDLPPADTAILVLDASQSARKCRSRILALARSVLDRLPAKMDRRLFFLGSRHSYPVDLILTEAAPWLAAHEQRPSVITPVFEALADSPTARIVVIGSGPIFDWEDWRDQPVLPRTLLASVEQTMAAPGLANELPSPEAQEVCAHLYNPVEQVSLTGPGFMPFAWDHPEFQLAWTDNGFVLAGSELARRPLTVGCLVAPGTAPVAQVIHANGEQHAANLETVPPRPIEAHFLTSLTRLELERFRRCVQHQSYKCPHCRANHHWHEVRCKQHGENILGQSIYPSVSDDIVGPLLFAVTEAGLAVYRPGSSVMRLPDGRVAVSQGGTMQLFRWRADPGQWSLDEQDPFRQYQLLEPNLHVVVL